MTQPARLASPNKNSNNAQNTVQKLPGAGDVPILGSLFRSTSFKRGETELVIVVTPYLVNPVDANDIKLPTDGWQNPNDIERVLGNMDSGGKSGGDRPKPGAAPTAVEGPKVGDLDTPVPVAAPAQPKKAKRSKTRSADASDVGPGFSLN